MPRVVVRTFAFGTVRAVRLVAFGVEVERVLLDDETAFARNALLAAFDFLVVELFDVSALDADQVIVVRAVLFFVDGLAGFKMAAVEQAGLFKLGERAINGGQADIDVFAQQHLVDIVCRQVANG